MNGDSISSPSQAPRVVRVLTPEGLPEPGQDPRGSVDLAWAGLDDVHLGEVDLAGMYRDMVLVRRLDIEATALQRQGELGLWAPSLGQEAAQVGSGRAMERGDFAFPSYREHGVCWARGVTALEILGLYRGTTTGGWDPMQRGVALPIIVIGNQALHAVGYAMGISLDGAANAAIGYFGDGATSQGDVHEACVFATSYQAPVVLFCQNNQWAISHPVSHQVMAPLVHRAAGYGMRSLQVDGNDVLATYAVTRAALAKARAGGGPTFIEALTYRMGPHTTSDDPGRYRSEDEVQHWQDRDPIRRVEAYLRQSGSQHQEFFDRVQQEADELAEEIRRGVRSMVTPEPATMFDHVYAEHHPLVEEQRQWVAKQSGLQG